MTITSYSRTAQVAYQDLLRLHKDEAASVLIGSVEERHRNGRVYLYDKFRIGTQMKSRYLGEGSDELQARLAKAADLKAAGEERRETMARLARVLRAEGFTATDRDTGSLLLAFARAGVFRLGGTLVGTAAYALYQGELGVRFDAEELAQTGDIDFASFERLSVALGDRVEEEPSDILQSLKFDPVPGLEGRQVWKWRQNRGTAMVEFLTPAFGDETVKPLPALGVSAKALNYLNFLIAEPIPALALYRSGVLVQIPLGEGVEVMIHGQVGTDFLFVCMASGSRRATTSGVEVQNLAYMMEWIPVARDSLSSCDRKTNQAWFHARKAALRVEEGWSRSDD